MECCPDFKKVCTVELSCKGRCFESFARGRECDCDAQCMKYGKCCSDYADFCEEAKDKKTPEKKPAPEPVGEEAGSGLDSVPPTPGKVMPPPPQATAGTPEDAKPPVAPDAESERSLTETTVETAESSSAKNEKSTSTKKTSAKEARSAEKNPPEDPTSADPAVDPKKPEGPTVTPKDPAAEPETTTLKPQKPTKPPKKRPTTKRPRGRKPKTTKAPAETTPTTTTTTTMATTNPTTMPTTTNALLSTSTTLAPNSPVRSTPRNEAEAMPENTHVLVPGGPVLRPMGRNPEQGTGADSLLSDGTDLCDGRPVDALTTLRNGTMVAFRGHYFWMLRPFSPPSPPRRITEVWGIPSPIDTAFTRCNCEGKTYFFKDSQYWRFTNDVKDPGYPKQIVKGFGGLNGKIVAALSVARYKTRPESVYFFKRGGGIQQYTYKQEPVSKCPGRRPAINYSVYGQAAQVRRRRYERAIAPSRTHTISIHFSPARVTYQDKGFLHNEVKMSTMWRGLPSVVTSVISLPNLRRPDGYDYYAFSKDQYYNIDLPSRTARAVTTRSGQTLSKVWYNCP